MSVDVDDVIKVVGGVVLIALIIGLVAFFTGTLVWLIWPHVIPYVLPGVVNSGMLVGEISWWDSVLLCWLCGLLFGVSRSSKE